MMPAPFHPKPPLTPEEFFQRMDARYDEVKRDDAVRRKIYPGDYAWRRILIQQQKEAQRRRTIENYVVIILAAIGCGLMVLWITGTI